MRHLILSIVERVGARLPAAALMIVLAAFVDPAIAGIYAWMILALTLTQAVLDQPLRQVSIEAIVSTEGRHFIHRVLTIGTIGATTFLLCVFGVLVFAYFADSNGQVLYLGVLAVVPLLTNLGIPYVAELQVTHRWRELAQTQALAGTAAMALTLPVLILTGTLLGPALQPVLAELANSLEVRRRARRTPLDVSQDVQVSARELAREWRGTVVYSVLGWGQGQADRLLVGAIAGTAQLGAFAYASALGRTAGDAVSNAGVNVLRSKVIGVGLSEVRALLATASLRAVVANALAALLVALLSAFVLPLFLLDGWREALRAAPVIALSTVPGAVSWHITVVLIVQRRTARALPVRVVGVLLALPVALAATVSLETAAWLIVVREVVVMLLLMLVVRPLTPIAAPAVALIVAGVGAALVALS